MKLESVELWRTSPKKLSPSQFIAERKGAARFVPNDVPACLWATTNFMDGANGTLERLREEELAALTRSALTETAAERREPVRRATTGLRVNVRVTREI